MTSPDLITEGISLMLFGMSFVFLFLTALVFVTSLMSTIIDRYFHEPLSPTLVTLPQRTLPDSGDTELVAVIGAAIRMHRTRLTKHNNKK